MYACDRCGKGSQVGMSVSHSHVRTKKRSKPNLHRTTLVYNGRRQSMRLCTKCLRLAKVGQRGVYQTHLKVSQVGSKQVERGTTIEKKPIGKGAVSTLSEDIAKAMEKKTKINRKTETKKAKKEEV